MRKAQKKNIAFVKVHLAKPLWYNQTVTHPNWPMIKQAIAKQKPLPMVSAPPALAGNYTKLTALYAWYESTNSFELKPPKLMIGTTA